MKTKLVSEELDLKKQQTDTEPTSSSSSNCHISCRSPHYPRPPPPSRADSSASAEALESVRGNSRSRSVSVPRHTASAPPRSSRGFGISHHARRSLTSPSCPSQSPACLVFPFVPAHTLRAPPRCSPASCKVPRRLFLLTTWAISRGFGSGSPKTR